MNIDFGSFGEYVAIEERFAFPVPNPDPKASFIRFLFIITFYDYKVFISGSEWTHSIHCLGEGWKNDYR